MRSPDGWRPWSRHRPGLPAAALVLWVALLLATAPVVLAADPTQSPAVGDPRSPGVGPGFVGEPVLAIVAVLAIGAVALVATLAWVRMTEGRGR